MPTSSARTLLTKAWDKLNDRLRKVLGALRSCHRSFVVFSAPPSRLVVAKKPMSGLRVKSKTMAQNPSLTAFFIFICFAQRSAACKRSTARSGSFCRLETFAAVRLLTSLGTTSKESGNLTSVFAGNIHCVSGRID